MALSYFLKKESNMITVLATIVTIVDLIYGIHGAAVQNGPTITTSQGLIRGTVMTTRNNRTVEAFRGIPYAEPPVGDLRFSDPVPKKAWEGTLNAVKDASACPQVHIPWVTGNEDCLYLNVYTPELEDKKKLLPVMVFVHGGTFTEGNGSSYSFGPGYLLDRDVVLVVINYRLDILGFLSTGDEAAPGNFGLKDQSLAFRWVQEHITAFGGDPQKVTIFGESAGGASISLHSFSDLSKGLFNQYIAQSGSALAPWVVHNISTYTKYAERVGKLYFCPRDTSFKMIACLRKLSVAELLYAPVFPTLFQLFGLKWGPTIEPNITNAFLKDYPENMLRRNEVQDVKFISGHVKDEGLLITAELYANDIAYGLVIANLKDVIHTTVHIFLPGTDADSLTNDIMQFYFNGTPSSDKNVVLRRLTNFVSDLFFFYPEFVYVKHQAKHAKRTFYYYSFEYRGTFSATSKITGDNEDIGVTHSDDLIYLSPQNPAAYNLPNLRMNEKDYEVVDTMVNLWTSFATDGVPVAKNLNDPTIWKPYVENGSCLEIGNDTEPAVTLIHEFAKERMQFWRQHVPIELL